MKQISIVLIVSLVFISCQNEKKEKFKPITDSSVTIVWRMAGQPLNGARAKYSTNQVKAVDSNDKVTSKIDTTWTIEIVNPKDTLKDSKGVPIKDSTTHQYKFNFQWYKLTPDENKLVKVQIINI